MADTEPQQANNEGRIKIDLSDRLQRNQYRCPIGHTTWEATNGHFWCASCAGSSWDVDPVFYELLDLKTKETIPRSKIRFVESNPQPIGA